MTPECRLGGPCLLLSREVVYGNSAGIAQCGRCSRVYQATGWEMRVCPHCHKKWGESLHDPGLGTLPNVRSAECGHGDPMKRYGVPEGLIVPGHPCWAGYELEAAAAKVRLGVDRLPDSWPQRVI